MAEHSVCEGHQALRLEMQHAHRLQTRFCCLLQSFQPRRALDCSWHCVLAKLASRVMDQRGWLGQPEAALLEAETGINGKQFLGQAEMGC